MPKRAVPIPAGAVWRFVLAAVCTSHAFRHVGGFSPATQTALRVPAARPTLLSPRSDGSSASAVCALLDGSTQRALRCVPLYGKKKKRGEGGAGGAKSSKLQVKLLKYVEGTGSVSASGATGNIRSDRVTPARVYQCHSCVEKSYLGLDAKTSYVRHHIDHFSRPPRSSWILSTMFPYFRSETSSLWPRPFITTN